MITAKKIKNATIWSSIETLTSTALGIFSILFLARLLSPSDYGQIATAQIISGLLQLFFSLGLSEVIIQRKDLNNKDIQIVWTANIFLAILCGMVCIIIGIYFYLIKNKILAYILYFEGFNSILSMLTIVPTALLMRNLEMKSFAYRSILTRIIFFLVAIPMAINGYGLWSIIYANLIQALTAIFLLWFITRDLIPKSLAFEKKRFLELINFGFFVMVESLLWSVMSRVLGLLIAVFHGTTALGIYNMASKLVDTILNILNTSITRITLPIFSSVQDNKSKLLYAFQATTYYFNLISMPAFFGIALTSSYWVPLIMGHEWIEIIPIIQIIAIMYGVMYSRMFVGVAIKAIGRSKDFLILSLVAAIISLCAVFFTYNMDLYATLLALAIPRILITIPLGIFLMKKICQFSVLDQIKPIFMPVLISILIFFTVIVVQSMKFETLLLSLVVQIIVSIIVFLSVIFALSMNDRLKYRN